jgi:hypothetical protein
MRIQHYDGRAMILSKSEIPHPDKLSSYEWVSDFVKSQKIQEKIDSLKEERSRIESMPISKSEYMLRLKKSQDDLCGVFLPMPPSDKARLQILSINLSNGSSAPIRSSMCRHGKKSNTPQKTSRMTGLTMRREKDCSAS